MLPPGLKILPNHCYSPKSSAELRVVRVHNRLGQIWGCTVLSINRYAPGQITRHHRDCHESDSNVRIIEGCLWNKQQTVRILYRQRLGSASNCPSPNVKFSKDLGDHLRDCKCNVLNSQWEAHWAPWGTLESPWKCFQQTVAVEKW